MDPAARALTSLETPAGVRDSSPCPCQSGALYGGCCGPFHAGKAVPETAEQLMRSRYSAYVFRQIDYLVETTHPEARTASLRTDIEAFADAANWQSLTVLKTSQGQPGDKTGKVEFIARYFEGGALREHREHSRFRRFHGRWKYLDGRG